MSHKVEPSDLAATSAPYGNTPFLVYTGESGAARINHVVVEIEEGDGRVTARCVGFGRGVAARASLGTTLSLLWPPHEEGGFSLIADGLGKVEDEVLSIEISTAVLHRPAPVDGRTSC